MKDLRRYWRDPGYWRYQRHQHPSIIASLGVLAVIALAIGGVMFAFSLQEPVQAFTIRKLITTTRTVDGKIVTKVVPTTQTITQKGSTQYSTIVRNGETITIPAHTVTDMDTQTFVRTVDGREVTVVKTKTNTKTLTNTQTETQTVDRPVTTTVTETHQQTADPGERVVTETETETVTKNVPGPTVTVTETQTETVTETVTVEVPAP